FGEEGARPAVGVAARLERVEEIRLETVVPIARVETVLHALRASHPYEEPAFDLVRLAVPPASVGMGRIGKVPEIHRAEIIERVKQALGLQYVLVAGPTEGAVRCAAACAGSCGDILKDAISQGAELYLTGELRHHDAIRAVRAGVTVVCTLHSNSERA